MDDARLIFIAGPTASGKSAAALALAERYNGEIINADAMQVYDGLRVITARPDEADLARAPHHLYGVLAPDEACSAGRWGAMAADAIKEVCGRGATAILVGGTGLYFKALEEGLSPIPDVPADIRAAAKARREELGPDAFREEILSVDPDMGHLPAGDAQRLIRAWEVYEAHGAPLSHFQSLPRTPLIDIAPQKAVILPERAMLYERCDLRARAMMERGGVEEVKALLARGLDPAVPVMKTLGVREIASLLSGDASAEEALAALQQNTRRFAKRQMTWLRNQTPDWPRYSSADDLTAANF